MRCKILRLLCVLIYIAVIVSGLCQPTGSRSSILSRSFDTTLSDFAFRGTTVPTLVGSNDIDCRTESLRSRRVTRASKDLDPTEPSSFGFVKIGKILAPHGVKGDVKVLLETDFASQHVKLGAVMFIRRPGRRCPRPVVVTSSRRQGVAADNTYLLQLNNIRSRTIAGALKQYDVYVRDSATKPKLNKDEFLIRDIVGMDCYFHRDYEAVCAATVGDTATQGGGKLQPMGKVVGVVPPDELCVGAAAAQLMHAQLEIQLFLHDHDQSAGYSKQQASAVPKNDRRTKGPFGKSGRSAIRNGTVPERPAQLGKIPGRVAPQYCLVPLVRSIVPVVDSARRCVFLNPPAGLLELTYELHDKPGPVRGFLPAHIPSLSQDARQYLRDRTTIS